MDRDDQTDQAAPQDVVSIIRSHVDFSPSKPAEPYGDWRSLPELPTSWELNPDWDNDLEKIRMNVPQNDIRYPYSDKNGYLEIHYRLSREEGITSLRNGVFVQGYLMTRLGPVCRLQFSTQRAGRKIVWTRTRRLTPGTIVAISTAADNFETICKPAVIADRSIRDGLDKKPPTIQILWSDISDAVIDPNQELVMIEARRGFFESVRHTLVGLQHVAQIKTPFDKYLVQGSQADENPQYVLDNPKMDISGLLHHLPDDSIERERLLGPYRNYDILSGIPANIGPHTSLDNSQLQAVHRILTKELAMVQGPPGTGKTFTSVQALRSLVNTLTAGMRKDTEEVIIVAAETNHAVDQILTHLLKLDYNVLRLGGRSKDEEIKKYNMFNLRRRAPILAHNKDFQNGEAARKKVIRDFGDMIESVFPADELLDPEVLHEYGIITNEQLGSLTNTSWDYQPPSGRPFGIMSEWLHESMVDLSQRRYEDPAFDDEEIMDDDEIDTSDFQLDLDDPAVDDEGDSFVLKGTWIDISRKWGGANPQHYNEESLLLKREMNRRDLFDVPEKYRGAMYECWQRQLLEKHHQGLCNLLANYTRKYKSLKVNGWKRDVACIKSMGIHIIGCTTTGLSKYRGLLAALKAKTILVEEAAQSREANIAAALFPSLQQLILVGDHQQLDPYTDVPGLAGSYHNITVSMFERLVAYLRLPFTMLNGQRRMITAIREVLNPFYPSLGDHPIVRDPLYRPAIPGMPVSHYLFQHTWPESMDTDLLSRFNAQEAEMVVRFAIYLMRNGTQAHQITILTFYRGQKKKIHKTIAKLLRPLYAQAKIGVQTVDSYQGEENDIILLSLVRSNKPNMPGVAGFVEDMSRGVVSISRARRGLYIFGNITNLETASPESRFMWGNVRQVFERQGRYFPGQSGLPIRCKNHGAINHIMDADTLAGNYGGCWQVCEGHFEECGHPCDRLCHPMSHSQLVCKKPCERKLHCGHRCSNDCGDECICEKLCPSFMGRMPQPEVDQMQGHRPLGNGSSHKQRRTNGMRDTVQRNKWVAYNSAQDDARARLQRQTSPRLIDTALPVSVHETLREEFRSVNISPMGGRVVADGVITNGNNIPPGTNNPAIRGKPDFGSTTAHRNRESAAPTPKASGDTDERSTGTPTPNARQIPRGRRSPIVTPRTAVRAFPPRYDQTPTHSNLLDLSHLDGVLDDTRLERNRSSPEDLYDVSPPRERNAHTSHQAAFNLPPSRVSSSYDNVSDASSEIARTVADWEVASDNEERDGVQLPIVTVKETKKCFDDDDDGDDKDLIIF
ncbi:hypothetical protein JX265_001419 [Neoarthrinium moseri]|uniref:RNA helicase n=1 Tax=Neoarthrinium moseri TaxID=1658444 RepID=A0A9Q0AUK9_9PEZI|nr:hypothetical protein JX265_001419 [Neoarthrinium moseri]